MSVYVMKKIAIILSFMLCYTASIAQERERIAVDSSAMRVLAEYEGVMPIGHFHEGASRHIPLSIRIAHDAMLRHNIDSHLWQDGKQMPSIIVSVPKFKGYDAAVWHIMSDKVGLIISNGSAYNYMLWPNDPGAYRDARTLSFPLPR